MGFEWQAIRGILTLGKAALLAGRQNVHGRRAHRTRPDPLPRQMNAARNLQELTREAVIPCMPQNWATSPAAICDDVPIAPDRYGALD